MSRSPQLALALRLRGASSLDSFIAGDNGLLLAALAELAECAQGQLFLWGEAGTGRSHLLEGAVRERGETGCFLSGRELRSLSPAVLEGLERFDLVAVDDVDLLAARPEWEEALFHLYNSVRDRGGAMVFAARAAPAGCGFALPDLASRLAAGPVWQLRPLGDEGLVALIRQRGVAAGLDISDEAARYLMARTARNAAAICAEVDRLDGLAMAHQRRLTIPFIRAVEPAPGGISLTKL
ncbi:MAG: DnaA regulatory inactivator Hda [Alcanivoracaceae bacterium]